MNDILEGKRVRLSAFDPEEVGRAGSRWSLNSEYRRLFDVEAMHLRSARNVTQLIEKEIEGSSPAAHFFSMRTLADDKLIGEVYLDVYNWSGRDAFVGIGIGEREYWSKGYGTDAMNILLRFAFTEVNLRRVTLTVFEYNSRAIRSYEKAGFRYEGRQRQFLSREGRRWDMLYMGILREEWMNSNEKEKENIG